ncbi:hypothetical protein FBU30_010204 [Linnemannia zychae]|nr:hypothetical protein FBU30_010204 [Linnemannia zychae]
MIKRIWYKLMGITTFGAVDNARDEENQGYVPLMSAYQGEANAEEGRRDNSEKKGMHDQADFGPKRSVLSSSSSALPRPKTILVVSLWVWTLLMFLSSQMGLNSLAPLPTPSAVSPSSSSLSSMGTNIQLDANEALWPEDPSLITTADTKDVRPFARIQTNIIIINGDSNGSYNDNVTPLEHSIADIMEVAEIEADIEDMDSSSGLDALIMDSRDEVVFHDFLHQLDQEEKAFRAASAEYDSELQDTQKMEQQRRELYQATDDLMIDNDLPCEYYSSSSSWFANIQQYLVGDSITDGVHYPGRTFVYKGWLTNLMIVAASMCLGGVLVGLAQSKALCHQLMVEQQQHLATICPMTIPQQSGTPWKTLLVGFFVAASALGLTLLMIIDESWDVPAIYFVGIGIAGLILVHHWVPSTALTVYSGHLVEDTIEDEDCYNDDDDTCIGSDTESDDAKLVSPLAWSPPMAERRNACSLDENRRWEVVTTATIHETIGYR